MHLLRCMVSTHGWQALLILWVLLDLSQVSSQLFMPIRQIFALSRAGYLPKTYRLPMKIKRHIGPLSFRALLASYSL